jgi:SAM-dependent methyltransferase
LYVDSNDVRRQWADRTGEFSPAYYAYLGPNETSELVRRALEEWVGSDAAVLELGCSSGRHLSHLRKHGFENLAGVEVNGDAFDVMAETYPDLAANGEFYHEPIEAVVGEFDDDRFDAVYSVETLQHIHPDAGWVFDELTRIVGELLVTAENEGDRDRGRSADPDVNYVEDDLPLYYRDWRDVFSGRGLTEVDARPGRRSTVRTFRKN